MRFNINSCWYRDSTHVLSYILLPLSWLFAVVTALRRWLYAMGWLKIHKARVPVIVVGNITVGGTGKTPFVIWLTRYLSARGYKPGIVSRGVGGKKHSHAYQVNEGDEAVKVGDEALLLLKNTACPVVVARNRAAAVAYLLANNDCDIIISDDGMQHYRMGRDVEIAVIDGMRRMGNKRLLPAGPLREPVSRLRKADFVIVNGGDAHDTYCMKVEGCELVSLLDESQTLPLHALAGRNVHAVAAIGHPERFFSSLINAGMVLEQHQYTDHYLYKKHDLNFQDSLPVIMTEKDAIKCRGFADQRFWYLRVSVKMNDSFERDLTSRMQSLEKRYEYQKNPDRAVSMLDHVSGHSRSG